MDGGSTDNTMAIVEKYRSHFAHVQNARDGGQSAALVAGFKIATGEYISWLNSDDTYSPGSLLQVGDHLQLHPSCNFVYGNYNVIDSSDRLICFKRTPKFVLGIMRYAFLTVAQFSAFWRKELYDKVGGIDPTLRFCMDNDLFQRMSPVSPPQHIDVTIGNFRIHDGSKTTNLENVRKHEDNLIRERYCNVKPSSPLSFALTRYFYLLMLIAIMFIDGSLYGRVALRMRNGFKSVAS